MLTAYAGILSSVLAAALLLAGPGHAEALAGELEARGVAFTLVTDSRGRQWHGALGHRPVESLLRCRQPDPLHSRLLERLGYAA